MVKRTRKKIMIISTIILSTFFVSLFKLPDALHQYQQSTQVYAQNDTSVSKLAFLNRSRKRRWPKPLPSPSPSPTQTPLPSPTPTPSPSPTPTPMATPTPTPHSMPPTVVPGRTVADLPVPLCPDHNETTWHPLVLKNSDGSVKCSYAHEHHDDPHALDHVFGPVGTYTNGQDISYPWQTSSAMGEENHVKHEFYKWNVATFEQMGNTCAPSNASLSFKNIRGEFHMDAVHGALVRYHSYWLEAQGCDPNDPSFGGIIRIGGHMDYGNLYLTDGTDGDGTKISLDGDPTGYSDDRRLHMGEKDGVVPGFRNGDYTWYGSNRYVSVLSGSKFYVRNGLRGEDWGPMNLTTHKPTYSFTYWYGDRGDGGDNSVQEPFHLISIDIPSELDQADGTLDGKVTYRGFTNRYGDLLQTNCSPVGPDCVPISVEGMKVGHYEFRATSNGIGDREYDVLVNGKSSIAYPN